MEDPQAWQDPTLPRPSREGRGENQGRLASLSSLQQLRSFITHHDNMMASTLAG